MTRQPWLTYGQVVAEVGVGAATPEITALFEKALVVRDDNEQARRLLQRGTLKKQNPHITDMGKCPRKVYFSLTGEPETEPLTLQSRVNFQVGHAVEEAFADLLSELDGRIIREAHVTFPGAPPVTGRIDFLTYLDDFDAMVELKSTSSLAMKLGMQNDEMPKDDHKRQIRAYLAASAKGYIDGMEARTYSHGYLVYVVKDAKKGQEPVQAFHVAHEPGLVEADIAWLRNIAQKAKAGMDAGIPDYLRDHKERTGKLSWICQYCPFKSRCWGGER